MIDTKGYEQKLSQELARVTAELQTLGVHDTKNPADWIATPDTDEDGLEPDPTDAADRVEEWDEHAAIVAELERQYNDVSRALKKIREKVDGSAYGACEVCGKEIEPDRLDANPAARTCKAHLEEEANLAR
jgi:RNA polymerase-binding transcription factor DksA